MISFGSVIHLFIDNEFLERQAFNFVGENNNFSYHIFLRSSMVGFVEIALHRGKLHDGKLRNFWCIFI